LISCQALVLALVRVHAQPARCSHQGTHARMTLPGPRLGASASGPASALLELACQCRPHAAQAPPRSRYQLAGAPASGPPLRVSLASAGPRVNFKFATRRWQLAGAWAVGAPPQATSRHRGALSPAGSGYIACRSVTAVLRLRVRVRLAGAAARALRDCCSESELELRVPRPASQPEASIEAA
jgi:hypothetical protein